MLQISSQLGNRLGAPSALESALLGAKESRDRLLATWPRHLKSYKPEKAWELILAVLQVKKQLNLLKRKILEKGSFVSGQVEAAGVFADKAAKSIAEKVMPKIKAAQAANAPTVELPELRGYAVELLNGTISGLETLIYLEEAKPWFVEAGTDAVLAIKRFVDYTIDIIKKILEEVVDVAKGPLTKYALWLGGFVLVGVGTYAYFSRRR